MVKEKFELHALADSGDTQKFPIFHSSWAPATHTSNLVKLSLPNICTKQLLILLFRGCYLYKYFQINSAVSTNMYQRQWINLGIHNWGLYDPTTYMWCSRWCHQSMVESEWMSSRSRFNALFTNKRNQQQDSRLFAARTEIFSEHFWIFHTQ